jgi:predicted RNA-binding Zn-ribbon protein involved in translation (DUF1610 family)
MTAPTTNPPTPPWDDPGTITRPSRDDPGTMRCPVCQDRFIPTGRQAYCSTACRKTAFRRRHHQPAAAVTVPTAQPRRPITVYECPDCGERLLGEQRCQACHTFTRRVGIGGSCPHCDEPVAINDLIDQPTVSTTPNRAAR